MPDETIVSADNGAVSAVVEPQSTGDDDGQGLDLSDTASDGAKTAETDNLTKKMSERINKVRATEVEPLKAQLTEYQKKEAAWREREIELQAFRDGKTVDEVKAEMAEQDNLRRELVESDPEYKRLKDLEFKTQYDEVMGKIKKAFPDDNVTKLEDLGKAFFSMLASGESPEDAYAATRYIAQKRQAPKKELPGSVRTEGAVLKKDFYTREEVEAMSDKDVMKNYNAVMASQKKWT